MDEIEQLFSDFVPELRQRFALMTESLWEARRYRAGLRNLWLPVATFPLHGRVLFAPDEQTLLATPREVAFVAELARECGLFPYKTWPGMIGPWDRSRVMMNLPLGE